jgi:hypothetical protein
MEVTIPMAKQGSHDSARADHDAGVEQALAEQAAIAARAELRGERSAMLGALGQVPLGPLARNRRIPERWSFIVVMDRMEEAFRTLGRLPMATRPRGYVNSMPIYLYDRGDLNAQMETYELERMAKLRNRVRIPPSPAEVARMEEALHWPVRFFDESRKLQERRTPTPVRRCATSCKNSTSTPPRSRRSGRPSPRCHVHGSPPGLRSASPRSSYSVGLSKRDCDGWCRLRFRTCIELRIHVAPLVKERFRAATGLCRTVCIEF